jgi:hypothetical protein
MEKQDNRYRLIKAIAQPGTDYVFLDAFNIVPQTTVARDLGMNYHTFVRKVENPEHFLLKEIIKMAALFSISPLRLLEWIFANDFPQK